MHRPQRRPGTASREQDRRAEGRVRRLVVVLGDQLDGRSDAFDGFDPNEDAILQMEVWEEATYVPQNRRRLAYFFSAMRHFRDEQRAAERRVF